MQYHFQRNMECAQKSLSVWSQSIANIISMSEVTIAAQVAAFPMLLLHELYQKRVYFSV